MSSSGSLMIRKFSANHCCMKCLPLGEGYEEKAVKFLNVFTERLQLVTNRQRIYEIYDLTPGFGDRKYKCDLIIKPTPQNETQPESCDEIIWLRIIAPPGNVLERVISEKCTTPFLTHIEYVILEDGSVWYWSFVRHSDYYNIFVPLLFAMLGLLVGFGVLWIIDDQRASKPTGIYKLPPNWS